MVTTMSVNIINYKDLDNKFDDMQKSIKKNKSIDPSTILVFEKSVNAIDNEKQKGRYSPRLQELSKNGLTSNFKIIDKDIKKHHSKFLQAFEIYQQVIALI